MIEQAMRAERENGKQAVILVGHGSRAAGADDDMARVARGLRAAGDGIVEICRMSGRGTRFVAAFEKCIRQEAKEIIVIPYFLHFGVHLRQDIPEMLREAVAKHPEVRLVLGRHLGYDDALVALVERRIAESEALCDVRDLTEGKERIATGMTREVERCRMALERAEAGETVALVSSGDPDVYGMACLVLELAGARGSAVPIEVVPGVSAANALAARLGAPLMYDFATLSLSDLLVPWETIRGRLEAVAAADLVALGKEKGIRMIVDTAHLRPPGSSHLHPAGSRSSHDPSVAMFYPNNRSSRNGWIQNSSFPQRRRLLKKSFPVFISRIFACFHKISLTSKDAFLMLASNKNKFLSDFFVVSHKL